VIKNSFSSGLNEIVDMLCWCTNMQHYFYVLNMKKIVVYMKNVCGAFFRGGLDVLIFNGIVHKWCSLKDVILELYRICYEILAMTNWKIFS